VLDLLHEESPVHAAPEVANIQRVNAVALDHRRGSFKGEPLFPCVQHSQNREANDQQADQEEPRAGLQESKGADNGPYDGGQSG
jgi:hypothetical protein